MLIEDLNTKHSKCVEDILLDKLNTLKDRGYIDVVANGNGRFGLTIEQCLGISPNSSKNPDFGGIELKTKVGNSLQTLFSLAPTVYLGCKDKRDLVDNFGVYDEKKDRVSLFSTFGVYQNNRGFRLSTESDAIIISNQEKAILKYDVSDIETSLINKHKKTAYINMSKSVHNDVEQCKIDNVFLCEQPSIGKFMDLINSGDVKFEFSMYVKDGRLKDYGTYWRVRNKHVNELYELSRKVIG